MGLDERVRQEALAFMEELVHRYYHKRDMQGVLALMDPVVTLVGTGQGEYCQGLEELEAMLTAEKRDYPGSFDVSESHYTVQQVGSELYLTLGFLKVRGQEGLLPFSQRLSVLLRHTQQGFSVVHLHLSVPDQDQALGHFFPQEETAVNPHTLRRLVDQTARERRERNRDLEALTANIPGGAQRCLNDGYFTMDSVSDSFISLFGYSREEIRRQFHSQYIQMIHPEDREQVLQQTHCQLRLGNTIHMEYRVRHKSGRVLWILDQGQLVRAENGQEYFYCILVDVTQNRMDQEELRLSEERHRIIMDQTTDILFEWRIGPDELDFSSNWVKKFGYEPIRKHISRCIPRSENIHPEDRAAFVGIMQGVAQGAPYLETEFRIRKGDGQYLWCRIRATTQFDERGRPYKAVGVILDIDRDKRRSQKLLEMAEKDGLTGLLNKETVQKRAAEFLQDLGAGSRHVLLIIDIDNFKHINDSMGHLAGDRVLGAIAKEMTRLYRSSDLLGRIGGDEFVVLLKDVYEVSRIRAKAAETVRRLGRVGQTIAPQEELHVSVGLACYPEHGTDYETLCESADRALYRAKAAGKAQDCLFE